MTEKKAGELTLVERWLQDQQEWQRTAMTYLDSMVKNEQFLTHLGNAMRGSLLGGKPYPTAGAEPIVQGVADDRVDEILHALHRMQGQLADLKMSIDEIRDGQAEPGTARARVQPAGAQRTATGKAAKPPGGPKRRGAARGRDKPAATDKPAKRRSKPRRGASA